jgi:hypothetical protein
VRAVALHVNDTGLKCSALRRKLLEVLLGVGWTIVRFAATVIGIVDDANSPFVNCGR